MKNVFEEKSLVGQILTDLGWQDVRVKVCDSRDGRVKGDAPRDVRVKVCDSRDVRVKRGAPRDGRDGLDAAARASLPVWG